MNKIILILALTVFLCSCRQPENNRMEISLNGTWELALTGIQDTLPLSYTAEVPVPGLVDMALPAPDSSDSSYEEGLYWHRTTFKTPSRQADVIRLKINKAKYHTRVYLNGSYAGENVYSFTPTELNVKHLLKAAGEENELVISIGTKTSLPDTVTHGGDFEKIRYIPGLYDDVKLIVADYPFVQNVQVVPDVQHMKLRVVAELLTGEIQNPRIEYSVSESVSGRKIAGGKVDSISGWDQPVQTIDFTIGMESSRLWTPESPFLYDLILTTSGDRHRTRFGMRTFEASKEQNLFLLNGEPYYMRGTNVCIFRFFEDPDRAGLPWDEKWVTLLHERFREMHWNSIRYCIGFPPERWYEIADSVGFLIQDEFPIWTGTQGGFEVHLKGLNSDQLAEEYRQWMRERWNHPCVVIWDAQNESVNDTTGKAIQLVRDLDLSNRPWDNGWAAPMSESDAIESHPYLFPAYFKKVPGEEGYLKELLSEPQIPGNGPDERSPSPDGNPYHNPVIINEYGWLWLNRNGTPTLLTETIYNNVFPRANTPEERLVVYAKNLGILTEYWRSHRQAAAVMHFCGLGYSRPDPPRGHTSDNFIDIRNLTFEPSFYQYVKPAFSPLGIMLGFMEINAAPGQPLDIPVHLINDTGETLEQSLQLKLFRNEMLVAEKTESFTLHAFQKKVINLEMNAPGEVGDCRLEATTIYRDEAVTSIREFEVKEGQ